MDVIDGKTQVTNGDLYSTKPGTLAGRYLRRFWQPLGRSQDIEIGRAYTKKIMDELLTVYRGEEGRVHVTQSHCPHRATLLSTGWVEGDALRCHYHGWKYDETGQCVEQPGEDAAFARKICLRTYPAQDYLGLVFAYFGEGEPPPIRRFPDFEKPGVVEVPALIEYWPCNLFNRLDNAGDPGHITYTHSESLRRSTGFALAPPSALGRGDRIRHARVREIARRPHDLSRALPHAEHQSSRRARAIHERRPARRSSSPANGSFSACRSTTSTR